LLDPGAKSTLAVMGALHLDTLMQALPLDQPVRIELHEGVPILRAPPQVQDRVEDLLSRRQDAPLTSDEERELLCLEEIDELLSLINRLVRNAVATSGPGADGIAAV